MIDVDESKYQESAAKREIDRPFGGQAKFQVDQNADQTGDGFNRRVTKGNLRPALAAPSAKNEVAQDRNIVVSSDLFLAFRTMRPRNADRHSVRNAKDAHIKEATDHKAEN